MNARWLDSLPEDLRKLVRDSAKQVFAEQRAQNRAETAKTLEELKTSGIAVNLSDLPNGARRQVALCRIRRQEPGRQGDDRQIRALAG